MILYHATPYYNLPSIQEQGLLLSKCKPDSKIKAIWLHTPSRHYWASHHIGLRHGMLAKNIVFIKISIPKRFLTRGRKGLWYSKFDILPSCIKEVFKLGYR